MHALWTPRATTASVPLVAIAAAATAAIALTTAINRPAMTLTAADGIELASGISVAPAPGWTVGNQGPGWVTLHNAFSTAEMEIKVKPPAGRTRSRCCKTTSAT